MIKGFCRGCGVFQTDLFKHLKEYPNHKVYINIKHVKITKNNNTMDSIIAAGNYIINQDKKRGK